MLKLSARYWTVCKGQAGLPGCLVFVALALAPGQADPPTSAEGAAAPGQEVASGYLGVSSCAAAACHNTHTTGPKGSEYALWAAGDPHGRAGTTLQSERSRRIVKEYRGLDHLEDSFPEKDTLCLSCHVAPDPNLTGWQRAAGLVIADGVGCESCHGPARNWITRHHLPAWKATDSAVKASLGFHETKNLTKRAELCVDCHVGRQGMDVNHDLIAAGHPRLRFDFSAYLNHYPSRHWSDAEDRGRSTDWDARAWALGQLASSRASLNLLAIRATSQTEEKPWPEWAEYQCSSCHQNLKTEGSATGPGRVIGLPRWGTWQHGSLEPLLRGLSGDGTDEALALLQDLKQAMEKKGRPGPEVGALARRLSQQLDNALLRVDRTETLSHWIAPWWDHLRGDNQRMASWDESTQRYLGLVAIHQTLKLIEPTADPAGSVKREQGLLDLYNRLNGAFSSGRERLSETPDRFDPQGVANALKRLPGLPPPDSR